MSISPILMLLIMFGPPILVAAYLVRVVWWAVVGPAQAMGDNNG